MTYRFFFPKDALSKIEEYADGDCLVVYSDTVLIQEPVGLIPQKNLALHLKIHDGIKRAYVQITTNKTADLAIDSKNGKLEEVDQHGFWKIHCGK